MVWCKKIKALNSYTDYQEPSVNQVNLSKIDHSFDIYSNLQSLLFNDQFTDVTLVVEDQDFNCHKLILASRSCYFKSLLFGSMKESTSNRIELKDISKFTFKLFLKYIYTGQVDLDQLEIDDILDLIELSSCYCLEKLKSNLIHFLINSINPSIAIKCYSFSRLHLITHLTDFCLNYIDNHASAILSNPSFNNASLSSLEELLSRDSFYAQEVTIFIALVNYSFANQLTSTQAKLLIQRLIRFSFISLSQLEDHLSSYPINELDAIIGLFHELKNIDKVDSFRGQCMFDTNLGLNVDGFKVLKGKPLSRLDVASIRIKYFNQEPFVKFRLDSKYFINHLQMLAYIEPDFEDDFRTGSQIEISQIKPGFDFKYNYDIYVSADHLTWEKVTINNNGELFSSWQCIYFEKRVVQFIKICLTHICTRLSSVIFHILNFRCFLVSKEMDFDSEHHLIPYFNVAAIPKIPELYPGLSSDFHCLMEYSNSQEMYHFTSSHSIVNFYSGKDCLIIFLPQLCLIDTIKMLLYDKDDRCYDYFIKIGVKLNKFFFLHQGKKQKSWQLIKFKPTLMRSIMIKGTHIYDGPENDQNFVVVDLQLFKEKSNSLTLNA